MQSFYVWCDANFSGNWSPKTVLVDSSTEKSRTGFVITFEGCPIAWASNLKPEVDLWECEIIRVWTTLGA